MTAAARGGACADPRIAGLRTAVDRLRRDLGGHPAPLADREIADRELDALDRMTRSGDFVAAELRQSLLLIVASIGSVSALAFGVAQLRDALEMFGVSRYDRDEPYLFRQRPPVSPPVAWPPGHR
ncbi:DUF5955 family protein [Streptomyces sp. RFCAC02]|uniref:DUF5955 family protein n=1 Tax=Streptomyces sp. RFCAC02 TaxID=2499143 RepID=UPI001F0F47B9|nr:DUF5955 family protein [Streptomyces sp. RFCAC02]